MEFLDQLYDKWIAETIDIIAHKAGESPDIILTNFDVDDRAHLYVLEVAKTFGPFLGKKVSLDSQTIGLFKYFTKSRIIGEVPRKKDAISAGLVDVEEIFKEMDKREGPSRDIYEMIYDYYYAPPTKKELRQLKKQEKNNGSR